MYTYGSPEGGFVPLSLEGTELIVGLRPSLSRIDLGSCHGLAIGRRGHRDLGSELIADASDIPSDGSPVIPTTPTYRPKSESSRVFGKQARLRGE